MTRAERTNGVDDERVRSLARRTIAVCDEWPQGTCPADFVQPVESDVPVLLLSGGLDPVTPPAYAAEVAKNLAREPTRRRAGLRPHRVAARMRAAADRGVRRRRGLRDAAADPASTSSSTRSGRRSWPDRLDAAAMIDVDGLHKAFGKKRDVRAVRRRRLHGARRRDHRPARPQRRRQDDDCCACSRR